MIRKFLSEGRSCGYVVIAIARGQCTTLYYQLLSVRTIRTFNLTSYTPLWYDFRG
jgi:hypothetical protein